MPRDKLDVFFVFLFIVLLVILIRLVFSAT